jgi:hypothetical protein
MEKLLTIECLDWYKKQPDNIIAKIIQDYYDENIYEEPKLNVVPFKVPATVLQNTMLQTYTSAKIGQIGEEQIKLYLRNTGLWILEDIKTKSKSTDIKAKPYYETLNPLFSLCVEVKKYSTTVPYKEVEKFYRDLSNNNEFSMGLFISINNTIARIPTRFYHETKLINGQYRFLIFLSLDGMQDEKIIKLASEILIFQSCNFIKINNSHITQLNQLLNNINRFNDLKSNLINLKESTNNSINEMEQMINTIYNEMELSINVIKMDMPVLCNKFEFDNSDTLFDKISFDKNVKLFIKKFTFDKITYSRNKNIECVEFLDIKLEISASEVLIYTSDLYIKDQTNYVTYNKKNKSVIYNLNDWV